MSSLSLSSQNTLNAETLNLDSHIVENQYKQAIGDFIQTLKKDTKKSKETNNNTKTTDDFNIINGATYYGSGSLSSATKNSPEECLNMCLENEKCTGATYNKTQNYCWAVVGDGEIQTLNSSKDNDIYAIILKKQANLNLIDSLNKKMLDIQKLKLQQIQNNPYPDTDKLANIHKKIEEIYNEQKTIDNIYKTNKTLNSEYNNTFLVANSHYYVYNFLYYLLIAFIILLLFIL